jgi:outer membrane protein insertion porin family
MRETGGVIIVPKKVTATGAWLMLFVAIFVLPCTAQDAKITLIEVQGNRRIETATILTKLRSKEGDFFSPTLIKEDIKALYQLGHFDDVQVKTEGFENGLKVIFFVKEKPLIREITYEGNEEVSTETLKEGITLLPRTAFNIQLINETAEKIRLKYQDKAYYEAVVVPVVTELRSGDRNVVFYIEEGKRVRLSDVIITGNKALSSKEIKKTLKNQGWWIFSFLGHSGVLRTDEIKEDMETIKNLYYNKGYIQAQVDEPIIEVKDSKKKKSIILRFNVKEGDQFRVGSMIFKGNSLITETELAKAVKLKVGDVFNREMLKQDVGRIVDLYDGIARPFATIVPQFNQDLVKKTVALIIEIKEGGEVHIGRIDITGNLRTRDKVIRRAISLDEGDLFSKTALKRSYDRLNNLNFFETIEFVPQGSQRDAIMDINVKVKEKSTNSISVGGGYSTQNHMTGTLQYTQANLFGYGQIFQAKAQLAMIGTTNQYVVSLLEPYLLDKPVSAKIELYDQTVEYDGYDVKSIGASLTIGKTFGDFVSTALKYGLDRSNYSLSQDLTTTPPDDDFYRQIQDYGNQIITSALTWSIAVEKRDYFLDPSRGSRNSFFVEYAGGFLGGDPNFYKAVLDSAWYYPLPWDTVFMVRGRLGYVSSLIDKPVPLTERFYVGGQNSVRGFQWGGAGPTDALGNRLGATKELIFNFEYKFPLVPAARLKGIIFYDIGRGFGTEYQQENIDFAKLDHSVGFALAWISPMGPIKFEFGFAVKKQPGDQTSLFDFALGSQF